MTGVQLEHIDCPLCHSSERRKWGEENGFQCEKCLSCGLVYVNPRPALAEISNANRIGEHKTADQPLSVVNRRSARKVRRYAQMVRSIVPDLITSQRPISWLDVGAGFGELIEALRPALPAGSRLLGIEPMLRKVEVAKSLGLPVESKYISDMDEEFDVISLMNVFSHIPDFRAFLDEASRLLLPDGELLIETGNGGDLLSSREYPDRLFLPDHLVFAGTEHIRLFLQEFGFSLIDVRDERLDTPIWVLKNLVKKTLGRQVKLGLPYGSRFRIVVLRARRTNLPSSADTLCRPVRTLMKQASRHSGTRGLPMDCGTRSESEVAY
jgi:2-polyprenyl-3-methyl-5-hydroxy-6-metoxy-1,4-benzoquinol methylase